MSPFGYKTVWNCSTVFFFLFLAGVAQKNAIAQGVGGSVDAEAEWTERTPDDGSTFPEAPHMVVSNARVTNNEDKPIWVSVRVKVYVFNPITFEAELWADIEETGIIAAGGTDDVSAAELVDFDAGDYLITSTVSAAIEENGGPMVVPVILLEDDSSIVIE